MKTTRRVPDGDAGDRLDREATWRVSSRRGYWLGRGLAAAAFALVGANVLRHGGSANAVMGAIVLALFGALALYALRQGLRRGPRLVLSPEGVDAADLGVGPIPWRDIGDVERFGSQEAPFLALRVLDPGPVLARMPPWPRFMARLLARQGLPYFSVNLIGVDRDVAEIARRAAALLARGGAT
jgi:hypothetical protein